MVSLCETGRMRDESSRKPWILFLAVMALLGAASLSTGDSVEATRDDLDPVEETQPADESLVLGQSIEAEADTGAEVEVDEEPEPALPSFNTLRQVVEAAWAPDVTVSADGDEFRFESDGLPNHEFPDRYAQPGLNGYGAPLEWRTPSEEIIVAPVVETIVDQTITVRPALANESTPAPDGVIGVLISGAQIINHADPITWEELNSFDTGFVDECNGHPAALDGVTEVVGDYHYHAVPRCSTDAVDIEGQHSSIIGIMIDGFPVYGSKDVDGETVSQFDLDACSGHFGPTPEFPDGIYHYHFVDQIQQVPFPCLVGVIDPA